MAFPERRVTDPLRRRRQETLLVHSLLLQFRCVTQGLPHCHAGQYPGTKTDRSTKLVNNTSRPKQSCRFRMARTFRKRRHRFFSLPALSPWKHSRLHNRDSIVFEQKLVYPKQLSLDFRTRNDLVLATRRSNLLNICLVSTNTALSILVCLSVV